MEDIYTIQDLQKVTQGDIVTRSIILRGNGVKTLGSIKQINGDLGLSDSALESLGELREIKGDFWLSYYSVPPRLTSLGKLQRVGRNANLRHWYFKDLGELTYVGGNLSLRNSEIPSLGKLSYVGGDLSLPKKFEDSSDVDSITVGGEISFWNASKKKTEITPVQTHLIKSSIPVPQWNNNNARSHLRVTLSFPLITYGTDRFEVASSEVKEYFDYFKENFINGRFLDLEGNIKYAFFLFDDLCEMFADSPEELVNHMKNLADNYPETKRRAIESILEKGGQVISNQEAINYIKQISYSVYVIRYYEDKSGFGLVDADVALEIAGIGLTQFGQSNRIEILNIFREKFNSVNVKMSGHFLDMFFDKGLPYKLTDGDYSQEYYRQFYRDSESFEMIKTYDVYGGGQYWENNYHVVEHAVYEYIFTLLRESENEYRVSIGVPKIGEGWISETELYYRVKVRFPKYNVIQHGHPKWLGRQHLDIYFPDLNIAIEYQGLQHYQPVAYFGGEKGYLATKERDKRKRALCKKNGCYLIYVDESYTFDELAKAIQKLIDS